MCEKQMKLLFIFVLLFPLTAFANDYAPFKKVEKSGDRILLTFDSSGVRFNATYKEKIFITTYGQKLEINLGDKLILVERHAKYIVTVTTKDKLNIQYSFNKQSSITKKEYEIEVK